MNKIHSAKNLWNCHVKHLGTPYRETECLTMLWFKFENDTVKNVVSVSIYIKKVQASFQKRHLETPNRHLVTNWQKMTNIIPYHIFILYNWSTYQITQEKRNSGQHLYILIKYSLFWTILTLETVKQTTIQPSKKAWSGKEPTIHNAMNILELLHKQSIKTFFIVELIYL